MTKICPKCNKENEDDNNFCKECGNNLITTQNDLQNNSSIKNKFDKFISVKSNRNGLIILIGVFLFFFLMISIVSNHDPFVIEDFEYKENITDTNTHAQLTLAKIKINDHDISYIDNVRIMYYDSNGELIQGSGGIPRNHYGINGNELYIYTNESHLSDTPKYIQLQLYYYYTNGRPGMYAKNLTFEDFG